VRLEGVRREVLADDVLTEELLEEERELLFDEDADPQYFGFGSQAPPLPEGSGVKVQ
jgi:hypothetical protein